MLEAAQDLRERRRRVHGESDRAAFKDIRDFTDADVVSDYRFLEEALPRRPREALAAAARLGSTRRLLGSRARTGEIRRPRRPEGRGPRRRLRRMPDGMTRRVANTTHYDRRRDLMRWRVEWLFRAPAAASEPASVSASTSDAKVDETTILRDALAAHLRPVPGQAARLHRLRRFVAAVKEGKEGEAGGASELAVFLAQDGRPANDPRFHKLNLNETIRGTRRPSSSSRRARRGVTRGREDVQGAGRRRRRGPGEGCGEA